MKLTQPIFGIFFDIGRTLNQPSSGDWFFTEKFMSCIDSIVFNEISSYKLADALFQGHAYLNGNHKINSVDEELVQFTMFYKIIAKSLPELNLSSNIVNEIAYDRVFNYGNYLFDNDVHNTLDLLSKKYKLGVISDAWPSIISLLKQVDLYDYFSSFTFSFNLGLCKPQKEVYIHAIKNMNLEPINTIFIDDSEENLIGATNAGIQTIIRLNSNNNTQLNSSSITNISDILQYL